MTIVYKIIVLIALAVLMGAKQFSTQTKDSFKSKVQIKSVCPPGYTYNSTY
jgi:hypothetical protein